MTMLAVVLPVLGEVSTATVVTAALGLALVLYFVQGLTKPRAVLYPRARVATRKAVAVAGSKEEGCTPIYRSPLPMKRDPTVTTLRHVFLHGCKASGNKPCLGYRPVDASGAAGKFTWMTYNEARKKADAFGSGIRNLGLCPQSTDPEGGNMRFLGFYCKNCPDWVLAAQGCNAAGVVVVPLYDTLGASAVEYVVKQTQMTTVVCSMAELDTVKAVAAKCPCLRNAIVVRTAKVNDVRPPAGRDGAVSVLPIEDVFANGKAQPLADVAVSPDDVATFCYTSGTTGDPKGAMLTHDNIVTCMFGAMSVGVNTNPSDVHISYLPLAHMFERIVQEALFFGGARIGFYQGETLKLLADIAELRPTIFPSVPRLYNKIYDKVMAGAMAGGLKSMLFKKALAAKMQGLKDGYLEHPLWDKLLGKVGKKVGLDRCRLMLTGSAPIAAHVMDFLRVVFKCPVQEGYGQTESAAAATLTLTDDYSSGHVGGPIPANEVRLVDVPDMDYLTTDTEHGGKPCHGRGEICFRGRNVFKGYFKNAAKTAEAIDADGWLHSGDIGLWTDKFELRIIDRKKNIFKLSQGEYVAAEKIENINTGSSRFIMQSFVYGDSLHHCLVSVMVPDWDQVDPWARENGLSGDHATLCKSKALKDLILSEAQAAAKEASLHGFERVRAVHLEPEPWTAENGVLTPTFKLKRNIAKKKYQAAITAMYESIGATVAGKSGLSQG